MLRNEQARLKSQIRIVKKDGSENSELIVTYRFKQEDTITKTFSKDAQQKQ